MYSQCCLVVTWLVPHETAAASASSVYITQSCTMSRHFMESHIRKMNACLAVTCYLHVWQNDRDLLRATAVKWGWNEYRNKSQHRKLALENTILPPLLPGLEPATFESRIRRSNHCALPAPQCLIHFYNTHSDTVWNLLIFHSRETLKSSRIGADEFRDLLYFVGQHGKQTWPKLCLLSLLLLLLFDCFFFLSLPALGSQHRNRCVRSTPLRALRPFTSDLMHCCTSP